MEIKILNNVSTKEKFAMVSMIVSGIAIVVIAIGAVFLNNKSLSENLKEMKKQVYVWDNYSIIQANLVENFEDPKQASIIGHLILFHNLFWSSEPYMEYIEKNYKQAEKMGGKSIKVLHRFLEKDGYYETNIAGGYSILTIINPEDIEIDFTSKPYKFKVNGKLKVKRNNDYIIKSLVASGTVRLNKETDSNYKGWYIEDYVVEEFKKIKTLKYNEL
ncbi:hypothetical protein HN014_22415 (plasmid) [Aquimarina sp. TRL1]|uniref:hypothetical protein n=1 Tax=Aquimarina sp. (strain TRL1) TaxID=2736252 RepID=UPI001588C196|nr:hypothetical protein [Aquimarina sp. TRL1]QKX07756.1 hypothetical protein HN014_22415 [Aquimarina sp. TRL1]